MKNILIPTDFTLQSISMLENYLESLHHKDVNLIFFSAFALPESEQDIVGSEARPHLMVMNEPFRRACRKLKGKYDETISTIQYKYLYGNSRRVFNNFLEYNKIDLIFCPQQHFDFPHKKCLDPLPLMKSVKTPVINELYRVSKSSIIFSNKMESELSATA